MTHIVNINYYVQVVKENDEVIKSLKKENEDLLLVCMILHYFLLFCIIEFQLFTLCICWIQTDFGN